MAKDVHTEHCCIVHGCKYGQDDECTVVQKRQPQSYPCEYCSDKGLDPSKGTPETSIFNFKIGHYYKYIRPHKESNPALLYTMGFLNNAAGDNILVCDIHMCSNFMQTMKLELVSSIQGVKVIKQSEWEEITKEEFDRLKIEYDKEIKGQ